ncbi:MAG TPA: hypothetical protein DDY14_13840 [Chromatiaceae bacterium]|nr:MAG: hypothetical protein N838_06850 [Thiohalocapsa sp. PB-PSB1]QQO52304.1 MAG: hypothetical protein N838_01785 [Thiohalocapsa sp. PB-PSB1]HBG96362.1 hypothetical protein [Chromatiaceae bacterium]HCS91240.1 hypothetical protein [Chromatiaceae bacterium]
MLHLFRFSKFKDAAAQTNPDRSAPDLTGLELGLLLEFSAALMKDGVVRCVNALEEWRVHSWEKEISRRDAKAQRKKNKRRREKGGKYSTSSRD